MRRAVALESAPESPREETLIKARSPFLGAKVANLSPALADDLRMDIDSKGVVVTDVENGSTAQSFGLQKGDVVLVVNSAKIETTQDLVRAVSQPSRAWRRTIRRGGNRSSPPFTGARHEDHTSTAG